MRRFSHEKIISTLDEGEMRNAGSKLIENSNHGARLCNGANLRPRSPVAATIGLLSRIRGTNTMIRVALAGSLLSGLVLFGAPRVCAQGNNPAQAAAPEASGASERRILTKNAEYLKLLNPPEGQDYLKAYSQGY